jgi:hypothetical protein
MSRVRGERQLAACPSSISAPSKIVDVRAAAVPRLSPTLPISGEGKRSDGLLGERDPERCCSHSAPPALHATALLSDSTSSAISRSPRSAAYRNQFGVVP